MALNMAINHVTYIASISLSDSEVIERITFICLRILSKIFRKDYM